MNTTGKRPKIMMAMSELLTLVKPEDEYLHLDMVKAAEAEGIEAVFVSEHVAMGRSAKFLGEPEQPRTWVTPGVQDADTHWPSPLIKLAALAGATENMRLISAALIAPLRHPILAAKDMATLDLISRGRFTVMPSTSWHDEEYRALEVDFESRGRQLDEHLAAWQKIWADGPANHDGEFYNFHDIWVMPKPPGNRVNTWFGGSLTPRNLRRISTYGDGVFLHAPLNDESRELISTAMAKQGRSIEELEVAGWFHPGEFPADGGPANIERALEASVPGHVEANVDFLAVKPAPFIDSPSEMGEFCRRIRTKLDSMFPTS